MSRTPGSPLFSSPFQPRRRALTVAVGLAPWLAACAHRVQAADFAALEQRSGGRLGVAAFGPDGVVAAWRAEERFPFTSTFKALLAAAVLDRSSREPGLLQQRLRYTAADLHTYAPVTGRQLAAGMTVEALCAAAVMHSDNVAANLLIRLLGGPQAVTAYVRTLGDTTFRLDRYEPELNTALPGDPRDTGTPLHVARDMQALVLGSALPEEPRQRLTGWLRGNTTGDRRIRAGVPAGWTVGDKTGTGDYGTTNDIAVLWPVSGPPLVLALYFTQSRPDATAREEVLADATRLVLAALPGR
jgi:beta-lactamase class A